MALPSTDLICILCKDSKVYEFACVTDKGLITINQFTNKYNELNPQNPMPFHEFDKDKAKYVHSKCRKKHTDPRQFEQLKKRKYEDEISPAHKLRSEVKAFFFHTDCYLCGS